jgi:hypothetical protein
MAALHEEIGQSSAVLSPLAVSAALLPAMAEPLRAPYGPDKQVQARTALFLVKGGRLLITDDTSEMSPTHQAIDDPTVTDLARGML